MRVGVSVAGEELVFAWLFSLLSVIAKGTRVQLNRGTTLPDVWGGELAIGGSWS